ncbi:MAG: CDP-alcohol phosphatidyltransferase family protein [Rhodospirillales bacterium]
MANLITFVRLLLVFVLVALAYWAPPTWQLGNAPLLLLIIALDGVDGWVARRRGETSVFGSIFDIAVDRIVESVLWIVLGNLGLIPIWVAIVFIVRGAIVDSIRYTAIARGETAFGMLRAPWAKVLVAGRTMRGLYGAVKAVTFAWVLFLQPMPALAPAWWGTWSPLLGQLTMAFVWVSVALCIVRGLPVVIDFLSDERVFRRDGIPAENT